MGKTEEIKRIYGLARRDQEINKLCRARFLKIGRSFSEIRQDPEYMALSQESKEIRCAIDEAFVESAHVATDDLLVFEDIDKSGHVLIVGTGEDGGYAWSEPILRPYATEEEKIAHGS